MAIELLRADTTQKELLRQVDSLSLIEPKIMGIAGQLTYTILDELFRKADFIHFYRDKEVEILTFSRIDDERTTRVRSSVSKISPVIAV